MVLGGSPKIFIYLIRVCVFTPLFPFSILEIYFKEIPNFSDNCSYVNLFFIRKSRNILPKFLSISGFESVFIPYLHIIQTINISITSHLKMLNTLLLQQL